MIRLDITKADLVRIQEIVEFASKPENWWRPRPGASTPDPKQYRVVLGDITVLFTYTVPFNPETNEEISEVFRHITIAINDPNADPSYMVHPMHAIMVAKVFGFEKSLQHWIMAPHPEVPGSVVVAEKIEALSKPFDPSIPSVWTIYDHPRDQPNHYVVREWVGLDPHGEGFLFKNLADARKWLEQKGLMQMPLTAEPERKIVETWV